MAGIDRSPVIIAAHIFGGSVEGLLHLVDICSEWTLTDRAVGIQAAVDDE